MQTPKDRSWLIALGISIVVTCGSVANTIVRASIRTRDVGYGKCMSKLLFLGNLGTVGRDGNIIVICSGVRTAVDQIN